LKRIVRVRADKGEEALIRYASPSYFPTENQRQLHQFIMAINRRAAQLATVLAALLLFLIYAAALVCIGTEAEGPEYWPEAESLDLQRALRERLARAFPYDARQELPRFVWQTWKHSPSEGAFHPSYRAAWQSWTTLNPDYQHEVVTDAAAAQLIAQLFADVPEIPQAYEALPEPVLKADFFRYLILLAQGGIYSDIDTTNLKPISQWVPSGLQDYGLVVGIEADPNRPDWHKWYARRVQFCQWTIASKPGHPVLVSIVAAITEETLLRQARAELDEDHMKIVMEFTGPGIWTDAIFDYFNDPAFLGHFASEAGKFSWEHLTGLTNRTSVADVVILPITSFSPNVGHMGSKSSSDPLAFVSHAFEGKLWRSVFKHELRVANDVDTGSWKKNYIQRD
jgi:alpha 1,6-mannosyltransferase